MLVANLKPIQIIGFAESTVSQEAKHFISQEFSGDVSIITPDEFLNLTDKTLFQYVIGFTIDVDLRKKIIETINTNELDCIRYMHDTVVCYEKDIAKVIGKGTFVAPYTTLLLGSKIGNFCIIETNCLIAHYATLGNNVIIHAGAMIAGRTAISDHCTFNFKSAALNAIYVCPDVQVNACSTLTKDVMLPGVYVGTPARKFK